MSVVNFMCVVFNGFGFVYIVRPFDRRMRCVCSSVLDFSCIRTTKIKPTTDPDFFGNHCSMQCFVFFTSVVSLGLCISFNVFENV